MAAAPSAAACRLALALGFDVSRSVDAADYALQREGLILALQDPEIRALFLRPADNVALSVYEWSGRRHQYLVQPWADIRSEADIDAVVATLSAHDGWGLGLPTAVGYALDFGRELLDERADCAARVIDLSGDGRNNDGMEPRDAYRREDFGDIVVNGLAIGGHETDIVIYYRAEVIRGPGAFVQPAATHADFPRAIRRKLELELSEPVVGNSGSAGSWGG